MDDDLRTRLRDLLVTAPVLGAEVDLRYRVLALTLETAPVIAETGARAADDPRLQVLFHPVGTIAAALVRHDGDGGDGTDSPTVLTFEPEQFPAVVAALDGPVNRVEPFPTTLPDLHRMEGQLSLRGMAQVADGHRRPLALRLVHDDLVLDLWATFDHVELRRPDGSVVDRSS